MRKHLCFYTLILVSSCLLLASACTRTDDTEGSCASQVSDQDVINSLVTGAGLETREATIELEQLNAFIQNLSVNVTANQVSAIRDQWLTASFAWAATEPYAYGPDGASAAYLEVNAFPLDEDLVRDRISSGNTSFTEQVDFERGLPALEFIFFQGEVNEVVDYLTTTPNAIAYAQACSQRVLDQARALESAWTAIQQSSGTPLATGTAAGGGLSILVNALSKHFEDMRRDRIGTPLGVTTLGIPNPQTVQSPYAQQSLALLQAGIQASQAAWSATAVTGGTSIADYLNGQGNSESQALVISVPEQYQQMLSLFDPIRSDLATAIEVQPDDVQNLYNSISRQVTNLKTDVPAVACIAITYIDNPSDSD